MTDSADRNAAPAHETRTRDGTRSSGGERVVPREHFPHHEMLRPRVLAVMATTAAIFVVFAIAAVPSDTHTLPWLQRAVYFASIAAISFPCYYSMATVAVYFTRARPSLVSTAAALAVTVLGSVPVTAMVCVYPLLFYPGRPMPHFGMVFFTVVAPAAAACLLMMYVIHQRIRDYREAGSRPVFPRFRGKSVAAIPAGLPSDLAAGRDAVSPPPALTRSRVLPAAGIAPASGRNFVSRLPAELGDEIIYIKTEGHYLRVYTETGTSRLLMRFADAVAELSGLGMQVHRSYWVALDHVTGFVRHDNRPALLLTGGHLVPVSRTYVRAVKSATST